MKVKLRSLSLLILMALVAYFLCEEMGIANQVNEKKEPPVVMRDRIVIKVYDSYQASLLRSSKVKGIKIYRGVMKKKALDEMDYIVTVDLDFSPNTDVSIVKTVLEGVAKTHNANVVIIDNHTTRIERKTIWNRRR